MSLFPDAILSAVNLSEAAAKMIERGLRPSDCRTWLVGLGLEIAPFDERDAFEAGRLRPLTRNLGLSFGDRACLALALRRSAAVVTADRAWAALDIGIPIEILR